MSTTSASTDQPDTAPVPPELPAPAFGHLGFIHLVPFTRENPARGLQECLELFSFAEELGLDSGWVRARHMQYGLPSPAVQFAALAQHTSRLGLGCAVIPVGNENPFRLAEDLAVADLLSGGRLLPGLSVHPPAVPGPDAAEAARSSAAELAALVHGDGWREEDFSYGRIERLRSFLAGEKVREKPEYKGFGGDIDSERMEPHSPGLAERLWYGGGSLRSAAWAGNAGFHWLMSNISSAEDGITDFALNQLNQIRTYREAFAAAQSEAEGSEAAGPEAAGPETGNTGAPLAGAATADLEPASGGNPSGGRVSIARTVVPTDGASADQVRRYREYVEARTPRTRAVHGRNTIITKDLLGSAEQIVDELLSDPAVRAADDFLLELPFELGQEDWKQILHQFATEIGPRLGWTPAG